MPQKVCMVGTEVRCNAQNLGIFPSKRYFFENEKHVCPVGNDLSAPM